MMTPGRMLVLVGGLVFIWLVTSIIATQPSDIKPVSAAETKISERSIEPTPLDAVQHTQYQMADSLDIGAEGGYVGLDQINLNLPRKHAGKGEVDLKLFVEGKFTNTVRVNPK